MADLAKNTRRISRFALFLRYCVLLFCPRPPRTLIDKTKDGYPRMMKTFPFCIFVYNFKCSIVRSTLLPSLAHSSLVPTFCGYLLLLFCLPPPAYVQFMIHELSVCPSAIRQLSSAASFFGVWNAHAWQKILILNGPRRVAYWSISTESGF